MTNKKKGLLDNVLFQRDTAIDLMAITFFWCLAVFFVNPYGDFPLSDDWSFGIAVRRLIEERSFLPTGWTAMSLITQTLWGTLFTIPFGFSFTSLRFSTLFLSLIGIFSAYLVVRELSFQRWHAIFVAITLGYSPLYFSLSHTFMTDVHFTVFATLALLVFMWSLKLESTTYLLLGACLATVAILCRQNGIYISIAFALTFLVKRGGSPRNLLLAILPAVMGFGALILFQKWLEATGKMPQLYNTGEELWNSLFIKYSSNPATLVKTVIKNSFLALQYMGLFLLPLLVLCSLCRVQKERSVWLVTGITLLFSLLSITVILPNRLMPIVQGMLNKGGIGGPTLYDTFILHMSHVPALPPVFWVAVTILSILGGGILLAHISLAIIDLVSNYKLIREDSCRINTLFFLLTAIIYFAPLSIFGYHDRYLIPLLLPISAVLVSSRMNPKLSCTKSVKAVMVVLIGCLAFFSITTTHDYLAWNRARWEALQNLMKIDGIAPSQIDGGFEFNGYYLYSDNDKIWGEKYKRVWFVIDDLYIISFGEVPGYEMLYRYDFKRWMPLHTGTIFVLKRQNESTADTESR